MRTSFRARERSARHIPAEPAPRSRQSQLSNPLRAAGDAISVAAASTLDFNPWLQPPGFNPWRMEIILIGEMNIGEHRGTSRQDPIEKYRISEGAEAAAPLDPDSNTRGEFHFLRSEFEPSQEHASQRTMRRWGIDPVARSGAPRAPATSTSPTWRPTSRFRTPMSTSIVSDRPRIPSMGSTVTGGP